MRGWRLFRLLSWVWALAFFAFVGLALAGAGVPVLLWSGGALLVVSLVQHFWRCPRCGGLFNIGRDARTGLWTNLDARACRHCGLAKLEAVDDEGPPGSGETRRQRTGFSTSHRSWPPS